MSVRYHILKTIQAPKRTKYDPKPLPFAVRFGKQTIESRLTTVEKCPSYKGEGQCGERWGCGNGKSCIHLATLLQ